MMVSISRTLRRSCGNVIVTVLCTVQGTDLTALVWLTIVVNLLLNDIVCEVTSVSHLFRSRFTSTEMGTFVVLRMVNTVREVAMTVGRTIAGTARWLFSLELIAAERCLLHCLPHRLLVWVTIRWVLGKLDR